MTSVNVRAAVRRADRGMLASDRIRLPAQCNDGAHCIALRVMACTALRNHARVCAEPRHPLFEEEDPQRLDMRDEHVQPHVELEPFDKHRVRHVP